MSWTQPPGQHLTDIKSVGFDQIVLQLENAPTPEHPWLGGGRRIIEVTVYGFSSEEKQENRNVLVRLLSRSLEKFKVDPPDDSGTAVVAPVEEPPKSPPPVEEALESPLRERLEEDVVVIDANGFRYETPMEKEARLLAALKDG